MAFSIASAAMTYMSLAAALVVILIVTPKTPDLKSPEHFIEKLLSWIKARLSRWRKDN